VGEAARSDFFRGGFARSEFFLGGLVLFGTKKKLVPKKYKLKGKETPSLLFVRKKLVPKRKEMKREK